MWKVATAEYKRSKYAAGFLKKGSLSKINIKRYWRVRPGELQLDISAGTFVKGRKNT